MEELSRRTVMPSSFLAETVIDRLWPVNRVKMALSVLAGSLPAINMIVEPANPTSPAKTLDTNLTLDPEDVNVPESCLFTTFCIELVLETVPAKFLPGRLIRVPETNKLPASANKTVLSASIVPTVFSVPLN